VAQIADGVIIGSKLIDVVKQNGDVDGFVRGMRAAMDEEKLKG
jgi:tryptophan synthase alpha subunit